MAEGKIERAKSYSEANTFDFPLVHVDPEKGMQPINYQETLNQCVKPALRLVYDQLMENLSGLDGEVVDPGMIDDLLSTFRGTLMLWEQIDQKVKA